MRKLILLYLSFIVAVSLSAQPPKLVVGIVVDQMRWDYLYRYYNRYQEDGGFKQLLKHGFSCENTFVPYVPTVTACGHTCIYSGSVPAVSGIAGNEWWDDKAANIVYCTQDDNVKTIGSNTDAGKMSPHNLLVTTIGDELHLADNFHNKVISIALKDRSSILPGGHSANGAYWYDEKTGDWITSSYYMNDLPKWVKDLNAKKLVDGYYAENWSTLYPVSSYTQSVPDEEPYEYRPFGADAKGFPYNLSQFVGKNYGILPVTPYGNTLTFEMAKAAVNGEQLGADSLTDLLAISLSTPDYIGHTFGPNSVEQEDNFLRLDRDLGDFLRFLDKQVGNGKYVVFLSADHGAPQVPAFLKEHKIPAGNVNNQAMADQLNNIFKAKYKKDHLVIGILHNQLYLDRNAVTTSHLDKAQLYNAITDFLVGQPGIFRAFALDALATETLSVPIRNVIAN